MLNVPVMDAAYLPFGNKSFGYHGENDKRPPDRFQWLDARKVIQPKYPVCFYTDTFLTRSAEQHSEVKIAMPLEPYPFRDCIPWLANGGDKDFDYVLSFSYEHNIGKKWLYYPPGCCTLLESKWGIKPKTKLCSMIVSNKNVTVGHAMRHAIVAGIKKYGFDVDIMGSGYGEYLPSKTVGLSDYAFTISIENERVEGYFSDRIVDPLMLGTIPIYWGMHDLERFFDTDSIIGFESINELFGIIEQLNMTMYNDRMNAVKTNYELVKEFVCFDDWIYDNYPFLFEGVDTFVL